MIQEAPQKKQFSEKLVKIFGQKILETDGFAPITGSFLLYQKELRLTNGEIVLIPKVLYFSLLGKVEFLDKTLTLVPTIINTNVKH